jgi:hypothetical protein
MKIGVMIKRLSSPRVRWRLKVALSFYGVAILLGLIFKLGYDIGHFNAQALENEKSAKLLATTRPIAPPVLSIESAQKIVSGALREDPAHPKTLVTQIVDHNHKLATLVIENNQVKKVAWIIDMRLFFTGNLFNEEGYNLTEGVERQHNINHADY